MPSIKHLLLDTVLWALIILGFFMQLSILPTVGVVVFSIYSSLLLVLGILMLFMHYGLNNVDLSDDNRMQIFNATKDMKEPSLLSYGIISTIVESIAIIVSGYTFIGLFYFSAAAFLLYGIYKLLSNFKG